MIVCRQMSANVDGKELNLFLSRMGCVMVVQCSHLVYWFDDRSLA